MGVTLLKIYSRLSFAGMTQTVRARAEKLPTESFNKNLEEFERFRHQFVRNEDLGTVSGRARGEFKPHKDIEY